MKWIKSEKSLKRIKNMIERQSIVSIPHYNPTFFEEMMKFYKKAPKNKEQEMKDALEHNDYNKVFSLIEEVLNIMIPEKLRRDNKMKWIKSNFNKKSLFVDVPNRDLTNVEMIRLSIIAELDAINLYKQFAQRTDNEKIKSILLDIAKEEKTHVGEFHQMLLELDYEQAEEIEKGKEEIKEIVQEKESKKQIKSNNNGFFVDLIDEDISEIEDIIYNIIEILEEIAEEFNNEVKKINWEIELDNENNVDGIEVDCECNNKILQKIKNKIRKKIKENNIFAKVE